MYLLYLVVESHNCTAFETQVFSPKPPGYGILYVKRGFGLRTENSGLEGCTIMTYDSHSQRGWLIWIWSRNNKYALEIGD